MTCCSGDLPNRAKNYYTVVTTTGRYFHVRAVTPARARQQVEDRLVRANDPADGLICAVFAGTRRPEEEGDDAAQD